MQTKGQCWWTTMLEPPKRNCADYFCQCRRPFSIPRQHNQAKTILRIQHRPATQSRELISYLYFWEQLATSQSYTPFSWLQSYITTSDYGNQLQKTREHDQEMRRNQQTWTPRSRTPGSRFPNLVFTNNNTTIGNASGNASFNGTSTSADHSSTLSQSWRRRRADVDTKQTPPPTLTLHSQMLSQNEKIESSQRTPHLPWIHHRDTNESVNATYFIFLGGASRA